MTQAEQEPVDVLGVYLTQMARYPLLSAEEEIALARQYETGRTAKRQVLGISASDAQKRRQLETAVARGEWARQRLIKCNLRLVVSVAKRYLRCALPLADLVQEGNIGLMEAVKRFDYHRGFRFATHAVWWIRQAVHRAVTNQGRLIRLPAGTNGALFRLRRAHEDLVSQLNRRPTLQELAEQMNQSAKKIRRLMQWDRMVLSLEMPIGDAEDPRTRGAKLAIWTQRWRFSDVRPGGPEVWRHARARASDRDARLAAAAASERTEQAQKDLDLGIEAQGRAFLRSHQCQTNIKQPYASNADVALS